MLGIEQISSYFPSELYRRNPQGALVEYLQYELLDSMFKNTDAANLSFIGGTAIRILHQGFSLFRGPRFRQLQSVVCEIRIAGKDSL